MKEIDIRDMLMTLETQVRGLNIYLSKKYDEKKPKQQMTLFDICESDYNNIKLDKKDVTMIFNDVAKKIENIRYDVEQCGVQFYDFKKAASEFHDYCQKNKEKIEADTIEFGLYQHEMTKQFKDNVNSKMTDCFNDTFTEIRVNKYFYNFKKKKGGSLKKKDLFDMLYSEVTNLPKNRLDDGFDEKGHFLGVNNIPHDTSMVVRNSINKDTDGNPLFAFQYKRNEKGHFECLRVRIGNEWFVLYEK